MHFARRSLALRFLLLAGLVLAGIPAAAGPPVALLTLLDGEARLLRGTGIFALAEGVPLEAEDIVETGAATRLAQLEFADGTSVALGPDSRAMVEPGLGGRHNAGGRLYLLSGWAKVGAAAGGSAKVLSPAVDIVSAGVSVLSAQGQKGRLFVESGDAQARLPDADWRPVGSGESLDLAGDGGAVPAAPPQAFLKTIPRAFRDRLPSRAAAFREKKVAARPLGEVGMGDALPWLDAEVQLRRVVARRWPVLAREEGLRRQGKASGSGGGGGGGGQGH